MKSICTHFGSALSACVATWLLAATLFASAAFAFTYMLLWLGAFSNITAMVFGNAPEDFDWTMIGGITCPYASAAGVAAGLTGSLGLTTLNAAPNATFSAVFQLRKNVPQF